MLQHANWITTKDNFGGGAPLFCRTFTAGKDIASAKLYITALGLYEAALNGTRIGDFILAPGWTSYNKRLQYQCYDVAALLKEENTLTVTLGNGLVLRPALVAFNRQALRRKAGAALPSCIGICRWENRGNLFGRGLAVQYVRNS